VQISLSNQKSNKFLNNIVDNAVESLVSNKINVSKSDTNTKNLFDMILYTLIIKKMF